MKTRRKRTHRQTSNQPTKAGWSNAKPSIHIPLMYEPQTGGRYGTVSGLDCTHCFGRHHWLFYQLSRHQNVVPAQTRLVSGQTSCPVHARYHPQKQRPSGARRGASGGREVAHPRSDIKEQLLHGAVRRAFVDTAVNELQGAQMSLHALAQDAIGETSYQTVKTALVDYICDRVKDGFSKLDLEQLLCNGSRTLLQKGNFLSLFLNENTMQTFAPPIAQAMRDYVDQNGETLLKPVIMQEVEQIGAQSTKDLTSHFA